MSTDRHERDPHLDPARIDLARAVTRRHFFGRIGSGAGIAAIASMLGESPANAMSRVLRGEPAAGDAASTPLAPNAPHFAPRAKRVIYLHMAGSPPQQDLWDPKPELQRLDRQPCPQELLDRERFAFIKGHPRMLGSPYAFSQHGGSGAWVSELLPHQAKIVDEIAIVRSVTTDQINHAPAELFLYTGSPRPGRPSMGSWSVYGLGSENRDLPGFVVLLSGGKNPSAGKSVWGSGFLPTVYSGVQCRSEGEPVLFANDPPGVDRQGRRRMLDSLARLNRLAHAEHGDDETISRLEQYELAFRMQMSVPETMDLSGESKETLELYGADPNAPSFARNCLLARRLLERGVRFVQLFDHGWDVHGTHAGDDIVTQLPKKCRETDQAAAALVMDLKRRGMLEDTLVVWSGEFGRTPMNEERDGSKFLGRDHHPHSFTIWMAGGGVKPGIVHGETDEFGYRVSRDPVHVHDLQATILHLLGLDHKQLTFRFQGRDFRLTDVHGEIVPALLA
jgi:hypothetical protein